MSDSETPPGDRPPAPAAAPVDPPAPESPPQEAAAEAPAPEARAPDVTAEPPAAEPATAVAPAPGAEPAAPDEEASLEGVEAAAAPARLRSIIESLLFAADKPLTIRQLKELLGEQDGQVIRAGLAAIRDAATEERGIVLHEVAGGFQLRTHPDNASWVARLLSAKPARLSRAALETLAIVAYRQPVTRADIDEVRGVDSGGVLKLLLDRNLIRILGKKEEPGRPLLYGTTKEFLQFFNLRDLRDLPTLRDYTELTEEHRARVEALHGAAPAAPAAAAPAGEATAAEGAADEPPTSAAPAGEPAAADAPAAAEAPEGQTFPRGRPKLTLVAGGAGEEGEAAAPEEPAPAGEPASAPRPAPPPPPPLEDLIEDLESAMENVDRVRREVDPPKPRPPRAAKTPGEAEGIPPADGEPAPEPEPDEPPPEL